MNDSLSTHYHCMDGLMTVDYYLGSEDKCRLCEYERARKFIMKPEVIERLILISVTILLLVLMGVMVWV